MDPRPPVLGGRTRTSVPRHFSGCRLVRAPPVVHLPWHHCSLSRLRAMEATRPCQIVSAGIPRSSSPIAARKIPCGRPIRLHEINRTSPPRKAVPKAVRMIVDFSSIRGSATQRIGAEANQNALTNRYSPSRVDVTVLGSPGSVAGPVSMPARPDANGITARIPTAT